MSVGDLRKELLKLQKEFLGGKSVSKMPKHEVYHRLEAFKKVMTSKSETPVPEPMKPLSTGAPKARDITVEKAVIADETEVSIPKAPKGGKASAPKHSKRTDPKIKATPKEPKPPKVTEQVVTPDAAAAPSAEKKPRRVPPKVVFDDKEDAPSDKIELVSEEPVRKTVKRKIVKKESAPADVTESGPASPPPVAAPAVKLPGGVRPISEA